MLENLKLHDDYDGMVFLAESTRHPPRLHSHHHVELELNLVVQGTVTYVVGERRFTFPARTLLWLFPEQEHPLIDAGDDSKNFVVLNDRRKDADLKSLARECNLSEAHLSRMFHRQMGVPLTRYRNSLRLSRFWENYKQEKSKTKLDKSKTLMQAAYDAGFGSYAQFFKVFTETYGDGPRISLLERGRTLGNDPGSKA